MQAAFAELLEELSSQPSSPATEGAAESADSGVDAKALANATKPAEDTGIPVAGDGQSKPVSGLPGDSTEGANDSKSGRNRSAKYGGPDSSNGGLNLSDLLMTSGAFVTGATPSGQAGMRTTAGTTGRHTHLPMELLQPEALANSIQVESESVGGSSADGVFQTNPQLLLTQLKDVGDLLQQVERLAAGKLDASALASASNDGSAVDGSPTDAKWRPDASVLPLSEGPVKTQTTSVPVNTSQQQFRDDHEKQGSDSNAKTVSVATPMSGGSSRFENHVGIAESPRPASPVQELPEMPAQTTAHRVSIDIGDKDSKVLVTLHERGGNVSVKVHAANETLKTELQSSVGSLVDSLHRAQVTLKNLDFTSGYGSTPDDSGQRNSSNPQTYQPRNNRRRTQETDSVGDSVKLSAPGNLS